MSMTLEEAIAHAEQQAIRYEKEAKRKREYGGKFYDDEVQACLICAEQHRQLAEWLKELKAVKDIIKQHDEDSMPEDFWYIDKIREAVQE